MGMNLVKIAEKLVEAMHGRQMLVAVAQISLGTVRGLEEANAGGNIEGLADLLFSRYVLAFEVASVLLLAAIIGALALVREREPT